MALHILFGVICAIVSIFLVQKIYPRQIVTFWRNGLVIGALIYVVFALVGQNWTWLPIELAGVFLYGLLAWLSKRYSLLFLVIGWGGHVFWDLLLHPGGHPGYVPHWYPGACLGFDLLIGAYLLWYYVKSSTKVPKSSYF